MNNTAAPAITVHGVTRIRARSRKALADRPSVALLAKMASQLDTLKNVFGDAIDKAALRDAVQLMHDVALSHDDAGNYGVYAVEQLAADVLAESGAFREGVCAEEGTW